MGPGASMTMDLLNYEEEDSNVFHWLKSRRKNFREFSHWTHLGNWTQGPEKSFSSKMDPEGLGDPDLVNTSGLLFFFSNLKEIIKFIQICKELFTKYVNFSLPLYFRFSSGHFRFTMLTSCCFLSLPVYFRSLPVYFPITT